MPGPDAQVPGVLDVGLRCFRPRCPTQKSRCWTQMLEAKIEMPRRSKPQMPDPDARDRDARLRCPAAQYRCSDAQILEILDAGARCPRPRVKGGYCKGLPLDWSSSRSHRYTCLVARTTGSSTNLCLC